MNSIKMKRLELLDIVKTNRAKHIAVYDDAVVGFKETIREILKHNVAVAKKNSQTYEKNPSLDFKDFVGYKPIPATPKSYEKEYDRAVRMLELSVEDTIDVEEDIFNQLVLDEWQWKSGFVATASTYSKML